MDDVVIIIPAYKPDKEIMLGFIKNIKKHFTNIVIVDDGSGDEYREFFENLKTNNTIILRHNINFGKGRAIKTAFNYVLNEYPNVVGSITADCDGQHHIKDIIKVAKSLKKYPNKLIIGSRNFDEEQVPFRSRFGNKITRTIFSTFVGIKITDTQTGLRAFGKEVMKKFLLVSGERYEYETNMLIECKEQDIEVEEVEISTIYIRNNSLSHFNVVKDSLKIYKLFAKYIIAALSSFVLDILLFTLVVKLLPEFEFGIITEIAVATFLARVISSIYNFAINSKMVFKNATKYSIVKYFILATLQMLVSAFSVSFLHRLLKINSTFIKIVVDIIIFIANFVIQREWVFKKS